MIDLRSDTVTKPTPAMRQAMAQAEVGDDVYGEDPTILRLEQEVARLLGKEAALFVPSGTMANQLAIAVHTRPGDEVIVGQGAHPVWYECAAGAALSGVQFATTGQKHFYDVSEMEAHIRPSAYYFPRTSLVWVENTLNRAGGRVFPQEHAKAVADKARERGLASHLDGARLWNASVASGRSVEELAAPFDTVSVCFSKGLGAPVGSALVGSKSHIARAYRLRKMWGGGMRQAGIVAAGALYALQHHRERLKEDHANARILAESISSIAGVHVQRGNVETNMVIIDLDLNAEAVVAAARAEGLALSPWGVTQLRAVTHLDVSTQDMHDASDVLARVLKELRKGHGL